MSPSSFVRRLFTVVGDHLISYRNIETFYKGGPKKHPSGL